MLSRRTFIRGALGGAAALGMEHPSASEAPQPRSRRIIVDAQIHMWPANRPDRPWVPGARRSGGRAPGVIRAELLFRECAASALHCGVPRFELNGVFVFSAFHALVEGCLINARFLGKAKQVVDI